MTKSECEDRTINLAKQGNSLKERKTKLLYCEQEQQDPSRQPCGATLPVGLTTTPKNAKRIRVCTGAELKKKTCPPPMCDCPQRGRMITPVGAACNLMKFGAKCLIAGGLVYWTWNIGLWGDADKSERLFVNMRNLFTGDDCTPERYGMTEECAPPTGMGPLLVKTQKTWNCIVTCAFAFMGDSFQKLEASISGKQPCPEENKTEKEPPAKKK